MKLQTELNIDKFPNLLNSFLSVIGYKVIIDRVNVLISQTKENKLLTDYFENKYWLELEFYKLLEHKRKYRKLPKKINTEKQYELYTFIAMTFQIYEELNDIGKKRLKGMLFDGFKDDKGVLPLKLEVDIISHLVRQGFILNFNDLENGGGFDFKIEKGDIKAEVECKCFSDDAGQKIHHREMVDLCNRIQTDVAQASNEKTGGYLINITVGSRLPTSDTEIGKIADTVKEHIFSDDTGVFEYENYKVEKRIFEINNSPFMGDVQPNEMDIIRKYCADEFGKDNEQIFAYWKPKKSAFIIIIDSDKETNLVDRIYRDSKGACKKQFSTVNPGILVVRLTGISSIALKEIAESDKSKEGSPSGFQLIAARLMNSDKRSHLHTVAFMSGHSSVDSFKNNNDTIWGSTSPIYVFRNEDHPEYNNADLNIFND